MESESNEEFLAEESKEKSLTAAQRLRAERSRSRALALREARLFKRPIGGEKDLVERKSTRLPDTGGGFLLEPDEERPPAPVAPPAPFVHRPDQPRCLHCGLPFPQSYLLDAFDYAACDACRDDDDEHELITRTEAKSEFLLKDCDLDSRPPPLRCVRRRNPHRARFAEMRLYLRAQVEERALAVWGSEEALRLEREERARRQERAAATAASRRLRALRMDVRSSLFDRTRPHHHHEFGPETYDEARDLYGRECACGHRETYEKM